MHRFKFVAVAAAAALVFAGSALAYRVVHVGALENGKTILLHPSDRLMVTLAGNATTGFSWKVMHVDSSVVKLVSRVYTPRAAPPKVGAGGKWVLQFRARAIGATSFKLGYIQAGHSKPARTYSLKLVVKSPAPRV